MVASVEFGSTAESLGSGDGIRIPWANAALDLPEGWFGASGPGGTTSAQAVIAATRREAVADLVHGCGGPPGHECRVQGLVIEDLGPSDAFVEVSADYPPNGTTTGPQLPAVISRSVFSVEREYLGQPVLVLQGQGTNVFVFTIRFWAGSKSGDSGDDAIFEILSMLRLPLPPS